MEASEILRAISMGDADEVLDELGQAIRERWKARTIAAKDAFIIGDRVQFTDQARRFAGQIGVVTKKLPKNVIVTLDDGSGDVRAAPTLIALLVVD
jgi:ribosomal protein L21E